MGQQIIEGQVAGLVTDLAAKAPTNNPTLTGTVTIPDQSANDNSSKAANTRYVDAAIAAQATKTVIGSFQSIM